MHYSLQPNPQRKIKMKFSSLKQLFALLLSYFKTEPIITGTVLTSTGEVAGQPLPDNIDVYSSAQSIQLKSTVRAYPLGAKYPPAQYLLRDEESGRFVVISQIDFKTLFIER